MNDSFADRVKARRLELSLSQAALAKRAKVSQGTIAQIELGHNQGSGKIVDLAFALNVSPEWLLYGKNPPEKLEKTNLLEQGVDFISSTTSNVALKKKFIQSRRWDSDFLEFIQASDDSMSPTIGILDDVVYNKLETTRQENAIFVIRRTTGVVLIRRLIMDVSQRWLYRSDNFDKIRFSDMAENSGDEILGRVIWRGGSNLLG